jgi:hypothetical protein
MGLLEQWIAGSAQKCLGAVDSEETDELDTPAARFARGEAADCGRGSGPFCDAGRR